MADGREPRPFLKWAGGKQRLLKHYKRLLPESARTYHEPFVGSGALFFHLRPRDFAACYCLHDANEELIKTYLVVRDRVEESGIPLEYLLQLEQLHDEWLLDHPRALLMDGCRRWTTDELLTIVESGLAGA